MVTPVAPHSAYNRGLVISTGDQLALEILRGSGRLAVEADGIASADVGPGDRIELTPRPGAARVVRLGHTTFYQRAQRKLRLTDSAEIPATFGDGGRLPSMPPRSETYLHGHHDSVLRSHRWRTAENSAGYLLPGWRPARACSTSGAARARSPRTWPPGCRPVRSSASTRLPTS